jgi:RNA recognition motif-containing protein
MYRIVGRLHQMTNKLYVNNIGAETTEAELRQMFEMVGSVLSVRIAIHPKTGLQRNYGFIDMETVELAQTAALKLNDHVLHDRKLQVSVVLPREDRKPVPRADLSTMVLKQPNRNTGRPRTR